MELPKEFIDYTSSLFGEERWKNYLASFEESVPVSVRLNPFKCRPTRPLPPPSPVEREPECSKDSLFKGDIYDFIGNDCDRIGSLSTGEGGGRGRSRRSSLLRVLSDGHPVGTQKGKNIIPAHAEALLINLPKDKYPFAELSKEDALKYLHHEAIVLGADVPKGFVVVTYQGHPLGFVKNIGNRANNLYPQEWKIRNL